MLLNTEKQLLLFNIDFCGPFCTAFNDLANVIITSWGQMHPSVYLICHNWVKLLSERALLFSEFLCLFVLVDTFVLTWMIGYPCWNLVSHPRCTWWWKPPSNRFKFMSRYKYVPDLSSISFPFPWIIVLTTDTCLLIFVTWIWYRLWQTWQLNPQTYGFKGY